MPPFQVLSKAETEIVEKDYYMLMLAYGQGIISRNQVLKVLDNMSNFTKTEYEDFRNRMLTMCLAEGTSIQLHNDIIVELLQYMNGNHPAFGNVVGEIYKQVEKTGKSVSVITMEIMRHCPEYCDARL